MTGLFSLFSAPFSLFFCLTQSLSSLSSSLLSLLFILSPSFTSLSGRQRDDGFVAVVTPPFSRSPLAPAASADDDTQIQQFSHVETVSLCVLGNKNEARQHEGALPPSFPFIPSVCPPPLARMLITRSGRKDNRRAKTNEPSLTIIAPPSTRFSSRSGCFSSQMFVVCGFVR